MGKEREVRRKATVGMKKEPGADKGRGETKKREKEGGREKKAGEEREVEGRKSSVPAGLHAQAFIYSQTQFVWGKEPGLYMSHHAINLVT